MPPWRRLLGWHWQSFYLLTFEGMIMQLNAKTLESAKAKLNIITSMAGSDPDMALSVLSYALMRIAHDNKIMFASVIQNLAVLEIMIQSGDHDD
jgi:hypothetical protein